MPLLRLSSINSSVTSSVISDVVVFAVVLSVSVVCVLAVSLPEQPVSSIAVIHNIGIIFFFIATPFILPDKQKHRCVLVYNFIIHILTANATGFIQIVHYLIII